MSSTPLSFFNMPVIDAILSIPRLVENGLDALNSSSKPL